VITVVINGVDCNERKLIFDNLDKSRESQSGNPARESVPQLPARKAPTTKANGRTLSRLQQSESKDTAFATTSSELRETSKPVGDENGHLRRASCNLTAVRRLDEHTEFSVVVVLNRGKFDDLECVTRSSQPGEVLVCFPLFGSFTGDSTMSENRSSNVREVLNQLEDHFDDETHYKLVRRIAILVLRAEQEIMDMEERDEAAQAKATLNDIRKVCNLLVDELEDDWEDMLFCTFDLD